MQCYLLQRHMLTCMPQSCKHSGVSPLTGKMSKSKTSTAVKDHMLFCDHIVSIKDF